ncbi:hypothetical protein [Bradyrhizobium sp. S3.5.5]|uniref:hypothetical protein n=1 Tax=Bradyrhizobium sp. S3.5.5 TaxID=3156430 RepID=UPI0033966105
MRGDLFWAVVDHVRTWLGEDGPFRHAIERQNGRLDGVTLRRIAIVYNVNRGIRKGEAGVDIHANALAEMINEVRDWPSDLRARAERCLDVARTAQSRGHTKELQASALTKLSWFVEPAQWTVYDRFVARAMGVKAQATTEEKVTRFYAALEERGFPGLAKKIQDQLDDRPTMPLFGARVLDKLMMLSGARMSQVSWADSFVLTATSFLEVLPDEWRQPLEQLAARVEESIDCRDFLRG